MTKYRAKKVQMDGFAFDSQMEARRYVQLKLLLRAKEIRDLEVHPSFVILVNGFVVCKVVLDFGYLNKGVLTYEDVKGFDTPISKLKRKLLKASRGIDVQLITKV